ncbi:hypothetical protein GGD66_007714 [Bradyrhizobium sp. CIR48]|uniref:hypothetical protein n=1 Tax=Bradyrhizobium sp. CIR48 TaxID=2663840 RepID=UPI0016064CEE|nr:hypothetical protein [Bradyrhizobium sp. CIR48]MBB4429114.1 hypothetical protein [Bradyrhizobium sp. CIR48]
MKASVTFTKENATKHGKRLMALALYRRGKSFIGAAVLLERQLGADRYVVLHLLCQGAEIILKALLLLLDYEKYIKQQRRHGHDLNRVVAVAIKAFGLHPMRPNLAQEVQALNNFYSRHLLRYDGLHDILIDPASIESNRVFRRIVAVLRIAERELTKSAGSSRLQGSQP